MKDLKVTGKLRPAQPRSHRRRGVGMVVTSGNNTGESSALPSSVQQALSYWSLDENGRLFTTYPVYSTESISALGIDEEGEDTPPGLTATQVQSLIDNALKAGDYASRTWVRDNFCTGDHDTGSGDSGLTEADVKDLITAYLTNANYATVSWTRNTFAPKFSVSLWGNTFDGTQGSLSGEIVIRDADGKIRTWLRNYSALDFFTVDGHRVAARFTADGKALRIERMDTLGGDFSVYVDADVELAAGRSIRCGAATIRYDAARDAWVFNKLIISEKGVSCLD